MSVYPERYLHAAHQPSIDERQAGVWVSAAGHFTTRHHQLETRAWEPAVLLYCREGAGQLRLGSTTYAINAGDLFLAPPHVDHGYRCYPEIGWDLWWAVYDGVFAHHLTAWAGLSRPHPVQRLYPAPLVEDTWQRLYTVLAEKPPHAGITAAGVFVTMLFQIKHTIGATPLDRWASLRTLCLTARGIDELAETLGLSKSYFIRRFKRETGQTPWRYALAVKIDHAQQLLLDPHKTIGSIALSIGFQDTNYFSRIFRQYVGASPNQYRDATRRAMGLHSYME